MYGNVVESDKDLVLRIWPAIVYQATGQLCRSILERLNTEYHGRTRETVKYRHVFLLATLITCCSLMISGIFFSSAWVTVTTTTQTIAIVFYGFFAGTLAAVYRDFREIYINFSHFPFSFFQASALVYLFGKLMLY